MSKELKYKLIKLEEYKGLTYRVKALKDFGDVKKGDIGGYVNTEDNLSQEGNCWVYGNACMYDDSRMYDNSRIYDDAAMYDISEIHNNSEMCDISEMHNNSKMYNNSKMLGNSRMYDNSGMYDNSRINNISKIYDMSEIHDTGSMIGKSIIRGDSMIYNHTRISADFDGTDVYIGTGYPYKYTGSLVYDKLEPTHIQLGCYIKTPSQWREQFWCNEKEFPKGSDEAKQRLRALNCCLK